MMAAANTTEAQIGSVAGVLRVAEERQFRLDRWSELSRVVGELEPSDLRGRGIYGGAQGIWVDKSRTGGISPNGIGITVSLLHTGRHYDDDLSEDGLLYHYPKTNRGPGRDESEVQATKNAMALQLPVFVILPGRMSTSKRSVKLGWVVDFDDEARLFLILFSETSPPIYPAPPEADSPFALHTERRGKSRMVQTRDGQQRFKFQIIQRYGLKCAVCDIHHPTLIKAAHICGKAQHGSDDWRNGLPLCANHHDAFDGFLFGIEPGSRAIRVKPGLDPSQIGIAVHSLTPLRNHPHADALAWRWGATSKAWGMGDPEPCRDRPQPEQVG